MSTADEYFKKKYGSERTGVLKESPDDYFSSKYGTGKIRSEAAEKLRAERAVQDERLASSFGDWQKGVSDYFTNWDNDYNSRAGSYQDQASLDAYRSSNARTRSEYAAQAAKYADYFNRNRDAYENVDDTLRWLANVKTGLEEQGKAADNLYDYNSQFENERQYNDAKRFSDWDSVDKNPDFAEKSVYDPQKIDLGYGMGQQARLAQINYDKINNKEGEYKDLSDDTIRKYNYILKTEGVPNANEYLMVKTQPEMGAIGSALTGALHGIGFTPFVTAASEWLGKATNGQYGSEQAARFMNFTEQSAVRDNSAAYTAGNIVGTVALSVLSSGAVSGLGNMIGKGAGNVASKLVGEAAGKATSKVVSNMATSSMSFMLTNATQNIGNLATERMTPAEYAADIAKSGASAAVMGGISGTVSSAIEGYLVRHGLQTPFNEFLKATASSTAGAAGRIGTSYLFTSKEPPKEFTRNYLANNPGADEETVRKAYNQSLAEGAARDLAVSFVFSVIQSYISSWQATGRDVSRIQREYDEISAKYDALGKDLAGRVRNVEDAEAGLNELIEFAKNAKAELNSTYYAGQQEMVNQINDGLDEIIRLAGEKLDAFSGKVTVSGAGNAFQSGAQQIGTAFNPPAATGSAAPQTDPLRSAAEQMVAANAAGNAAGQASLDTKVNTDPSEHTPAEQAVIDEYVNAVDDNLVQFYKQSQSGKDNRGKYQISEVSARQNELLQELTGGNYSGYLNEVDESTARHVEKRHGENGTGDHSMANPEDFGRVGYVLSNPDSAAYAMKNGKVARSSSYNGSDGEAAPIVLLSKKVNGTYYIAETVADNKAHKLHVISAYMDKKNTGASQTVHAGDQSALPLRPKTPLENDTPVTGNVSQDEDSVNTAFSRLIPAEKGILDSARGLIKNSITRGEADQMMLDTFDTLIAKRIQRTGTIPSDLDAYLFDYDSFYQAGKDGTDITTVKNEGALSTKEQEAAYLAGQIEAETASSSDNVSNTKRALAIILDPDSAKDNNMVSESGNGYSVNSFTSLYSELPDGRIKPNNIDDLSTEDWKLIQKAVKKLGYEVNSAKQAKEIYSRYVGKNGFNEEQSAAIKKAYGITAGKSSSVNLKHEALARKTFGTTGDFREAGYLMRNGAMLDFSGKKDGGSAHTRAMDHREINSIFSDGEISDEETRYGNLSAYMNKFISEGNIRLMDGQGVTIGEMEPTQQQYSILKRFIDHVLDDEGYFYLDLSNDKGYTVESRDYEPSDGSSRIIRDIKEYFKNGELPYKSELSPFLHERSGKKIDIDGQITISDFENYLESKYENADKQDIKTAAKATKGIIERIQNFQKKLAEGTGALSGPARTVALGVTSEFIKTGYVDFGKLKLDSDPMKAAGQIAAYSMILRNPNFETFRILYTKGDRIVANAAATTYNVDRAVAGLRVKDNLAYIANQMKRLGADGYYLMHNHPSGDVSYSDPDKSVTNDYKKNLPGFKGHIIIDHNEYGLFAKDGSFSKNKIENGAAKEENKRVIDSPLLYKYLFSPDAVASIAKEVVHNKDYSTVIYSGNAGIRAIQEVDNRFLKSKDFANYVKNRKLDFGSPQAFVVTNAQTFSELDNLFYSGQFTDIVYEGKDFDGNDEFYSMRMLGRRQRSSLYDKVNLNRVYEEAPDYNPKKTIDVYKLMRLKDGKLYPLFIDQASEVKLNTWYTADSPDLSVLKKMPSGTFLVDYEKQTYETLADYQDRNGLKHTVKPRPEDLDQAANEGKRWVKIEDTERAQKRFEGENRKYWNLGTTESEKDGKTTRKVEEYSMRPGWHAGSLPSMQQIPNTNADRTFVWVKGKIPADISYQEEAEMNPEKDIPTHIPTDGYYLKATNADKVKSQADKIGWYVAGAFKPERIMSYAEARDVIDQWNKEHPSDEPVQYDYDRLHGKDIDPDTLAIEVNGSDDSMIAGEGNNVSFSDVSVLRTIGDKSINSFTDENVEQTEKWAAKFYQELKTKSPYFRRWFGDWRSFDKSEIMPVKSKGEMQFQSLKNRDTKWDIIVGKAIQKETKSKNSRSFSTAVKYLPYLKEIVENAILLDTVTSQDKKSRSDFSAFFHYLYTYIEDDNRPVVLKLGVEELTMEKEDGTFKRTYTLQNITEATPSGNRFSIPKPEVIASPKTVADLYSLVKQYDKGFTPSPQKVQTEFLNEDGTPKGFYHGSKSGGGFSTFKNWQFFTANKNYAERYAERGNEKSLYEVYLKGNHVFDTRSAAEKKIFNEMRSEYGLSELQENGLPDWTDGYDIADFIDENDLDYDVIILDEGGDLVNGEPISRGLSYMVKDSSQIKSVDNAGTFNNQKNILREESLYSVRETSSYSTDRNTDALQDLRRQLIDALRENAIMKKQIEEYEKQFKVSGATFTDASMKKWVRSITKEYGNKINLDIVESSLKNAGEIFFKERKNLEPDALEGKIREALLPAAGEIVKNASVPAEDGNQANYRSLRQTLKKGIRISDQDKHDIPDYNDWRKANIGYVTISDKGQPMDTLWSELQSEFGKGLFPDEITHPADQLMHAVEVLKDMNAIYENPYQNYDMAEAVDYVDRNLLESLYNGILKQTAPTFADKMEARIEAERQSVMKKVESAVEANQKVNDRLIEHLKKQYKENLKMAVRAQRLQDMAEKDRISANEKLRRIVKRLRNKKLSPVNRARVDEYIKDLDAFSVGLTGAKLEDLRSLDDFVRDHNEIIFPDRVKKDIERLRMKHISELTPDEVASLTEVLLSIETEVNNLNKQIDAQDKRDTFRQASQVMDDISKTKGTKAGLIRDIDDAFILETLSPERFFNRITGYVDNDPMVLAGHDLSNGEAKMQDHIMRASKIFDKWTENAKLMRKWQGKYADQIEITGERVGGKGKVSVKVTPAMRMSLYMHSLNDDNMRHIQYGGIVIPDMKLYKSGQYDDAYSKGTKIRLTRADIRKIASGMTAEERAFINAAQSYYQGMSQDEINDVSVKLLGFELAAEDNYFPIHTDKDFRRNDFSGLQHDGTIEGMGSLKQRVTSTIPIVLDDITNVVNRSIKETAKYVGLAIPVRNMNNLLGVTSGSFVDIGRFKGDITVYAAEDSILHEINKKWGAPAIEYLRQVMRNLQTSGKDTPIYESLLRRVRSNYAGSVLMLNAGVALKQAASYPTAAAVLGWKPVLKAMRFDQFGKVDLDNIAKYTPVQWYRSRGFSTQEIGDIKASGINIPPFLNWIQLMDLMTTRKLWKASEFYVQDEFPDLKKGTDAYFETVAEVYNRVIWETQPNYTTMQRPGNLRSDNFLVQTLMMFKTQPFQNFNIIYDSVANLKAKETQYLAAKQYGTDAERESADKALKRAKKDLFNSLTSQFVSMVVFAGMTAVWNTLRGKWDKYKDKEGNVNVLSVLGGLGKDVLGGAAGVIPFGSDLWEILSSWVFKDRYYGYSSVSESAIKDFLDTMASTGTAIIEGKMTPAKWKKLAKDMAQTLGIPAKNVAGLVNMILSWFGAEEVL